MAQNLGTAHYPGIQAYESFSFCDQAGVTPATGKMTVFPQYGLPDENGDIVVGYNGQTVLTFKNCHIDSAYYEQGSGGRIVSVRFLDERWAWKDRSISGRYNYRLPNNWVDPAHERTPRQLATLCFQALGVLAFDVSALPNDSRPEVSWDSSSPAQELEKLCNDLGCRVVPIRSDGSWRICVTGEGNSLPDGAVEESGDGIDPAETPDYIKIVTGPIRYQVFLPLGAVGKDTDMSWKAIRDLSYAPNRNMSSAGFYKDPNEFRFLSSITYVPAGGTGSYSGVTRVPLPDGTKVSAQELARDTVFKSWRLDFLRKTGAKQSGGNGAWYMRIPGVTKNGGYVSLEQIILSDKLVDSYTDNLGTQHERPAFVCGSFFGKLEVSYPDGTRIDKQAERSGERQDERASFSLSLDPIDTNRSIISTSGPMLIITESDEKWIPANLQYCCAVHVRDPDTWQPVRYESLYQIGSGTNPAFCRVEIKDDIQPYVIGKYPTGSNAFTSFKTNFAEVESQCQYYAQSVAREYQLVTSSTKSYIGILQIDMDGAIQQVSYEIGKGGSTTRASRGTEHSWYTPAYEERRRQIARQGIDGKVAYAQSESARRQALIGRYNT